jgi:hypothetical protein
MTADPRMRAGRARVSGQPGPRKRPTGPAPGVGPDPGQACSALVRAIAALAPPRRGRAEPPPPTLMTERSRVTTMRNCLLTPRRQNEKNASARNHRDLGCGNGAERHNYCCFRPAHEKPNAK